MMRLHPNRSRPEAVSPLWAMVLPAAMLVAVASVSAAALVLVGELLSAGIPS